MKNRISIAQVTEADLEEMTDNIRMRDRSELLMTGAKSAIGDVVRSVNKSVVCLACRHVKTKKLLCICGVVPTSLVSESASIWEIGTKEMDRHKRLAVIHAPTVLKMLMDATPTIKTYFNAIPSAYHEYIAWAEKYLGAEFQTGLAISATGHKFKMFTIKRGA